MLMEDRILTKTMMINCNYDPKFFNVQREFLFKLALNLQLSSDETMSVLVTHCHPMCLEEYLTN